MNEKQFSALFGGGALLLLSLIIYAIVRLNHTDSIISDRQKDRQTLWDFQCAANVTMTLAQLCTKGGHLGNRCNEISEMPYFALIKTCINVCNNYYSDENEMAFDFMAEGFAIIGAIMMLGIFGYATCNGYKAFQDEKVASQGETRPLNPSINGDSYHGCDVEEAQENKAALRTMGAYN